MRADRSGMVEFFENFFDVFKHFQNAFLIDHMIGGMFGGTLLLLFLVVFFLSLIRGLR